MHDKYQVTAGEAPASTNRKGGKEHLRKRNPSRADEPLTPREGTSPKPVKLGPSSLIYTLSS